MSENVRVRVVGLESKAPEARASRSAGSSESTDLASNQIAGASHTFDLHTLISHRFSLTGSAPLEAVQKFFSSHDLEFVAVLEDGSVVGLCARRQIGIVLGSRYGFALFSNKPVREYLLPQALLIRTTNSIHEILGQLSARPDENFYDDVLLMDEKGGFLGSIFVRTLVRLQHGLLLDNIRELEGKRVEIERKNEQMEQELIMAGKVQHAMLPQLYPSFPPSLSIQASTLRFHHRYLPVGKVSGDFFHVLRISDRVVGIFICDVMGHGVRSAMITAMLRALVEELQSKASHPGELLGRLNHDLYSILHQNDETMYASAIYMVFDTATLQIRWATAGHPCPVHLRGGDGSVEQMSLTGKKPGKVLGLFEHSAYDTSELNLKSGDRVLLFTDGIYEVFSGETEFGVAGLLGTLWRFSELPTAQLLDRILETARAFGATQNFEDDVCLLAMETVPIGNQ